MRDLFYVTPLWVVLLVLRQVVALAGLLVTPVALLFAREVESQRPQMERALGKLVWEDWKLIRLPAWAWPWDNLRDGAMGDIRGLYWFEQAPKWLKTDYLKQLWWLAWRNPCNNFSRFIPLLGVNLVNKEVVTLASSDAYRFYKVKRHPYWNLHLRLFNGTLKLGHKIFPKHNLTDWSRDPQKAIKGITFRYDLSLDTLS
ncbi:MAG: hypothetical protein LHW56_01600 [Candidatus Cloacimonetes bacterium]|nr:hypothetical protein [Candidatus Cloacimonadota bacterium]MDY0171582.1 hypothetical protein [Candidatus Cloacimonadaceae bacterium]